MGGNDSTDDEVKQGFVRLVDFIAKKEVNPYFSLRSVAYRAYKLQDQLFKAEIGAHQDGEGSHSGSEELSHVEHYQIRKSA